jgi:sec-independent protein translocase protein TatC
MLGGILLACPVWLYQAWMFVAPGLYANERKYSIIFIGSGVVLFLSGSLFVYFLVLPMAFGFLLPFMAEAAKPMITISEYMSFFTTMTLVFGVAFELPLVLVLLGLIGLIDATFLRKNRRYAVMILAIVSALITPPDAMSMMMLLVPLYVLYELSIICLVLIGKKKAAAPADEGLQ